jgi:hypothetical protein
MKLGKGRWGLSAISELDNHNCSRKCLRRRNDTSNGRFLSSEGIISASLTYFGGFLAFSNLWPFQPLWRKDGRRLCVTGY